MEPLRPAARLIQVTTTATCYIDATDMLLAHIRCAVITGLLALSLGGCTVTGRILEPATSAPEPAPDRGVNAALRQLVR